LDRINRAASLRLPAARRGAHGAQLCDGRLWLRHGLREASGAAAGANRWAERWPACREIAQHARFFSERRVALRNG